MFQDEALEVMISFSWKLLVINEVAYKRMTNSTNSLELMNREYFY